MANYCEKCEWSDWSYVSDPRVYEFACSMCNAGSSRMPRKTFTPPKPIKEKDITKLDWTVLP